MTRKEQEVLIRLVESLNQGKSAYTCDRVAIALSQITQLKEAGCNFDDEE